MSLDENNNQVLSSDEREQLEQLFMGMDKTVEEFKRDPELAQRFLERIGYFRAMEDERREKEEQAK